MALVAASIRMTTMILNVGLKHLDRSRGAVIGTPCPSESSRPPQKEQKTTSHVKDVPANGSRAGAGEEGAVDVWCFFCAVSLCVQDICCLLT